MIVSHLSLSRIRCLRCKVAEVLRVKRAPEASVSSKFRKRLLLLASASNPSAAHTSLSGGGSESAASLGYSRRYHDRPWPNVHSSPPRSSVPLNQWHWEQIYLSPRGPCGELCHILMERGRRRPTVRKIGFPMRSQWFILFLIFSSAASKVVMEYISYIHFLKPPLEYSRIFVSVFQNSLQRPILIKSLFNTSYTYSAVALNKRNLIWPISWVLSHI